MEAQETEKVVKPKKQQHKNVTFLSSSQRRAQRVNRLRLNKPQRFNQSSSSSTTILDETDELIGCNTDRLAKPVFITGHRKQQQSGKLPDVYYPATDLQLSSSSSEFTIDPPSKQKPGVTGPQGRPHHRRKRAPTPDYFQPDGSQHRGEVGSWKENTLPKNTLLHTEESRWRHCCFLTPEFPCFWRKRERGTGGDARGVAVFLVRTAACQLGLGGVILVGSVGFGVVESGQSRLLRGPRLPACLSG